VAYAGELSGLPAAPALSRAHEMLDYVGMNEERYRRVDTYSVGMRQRIKLAHALCHSPRVLVLDEPLNGLDPMGRAEMIRLFQELAADGRFVIVSSHILHEVDAICDAVVMVHGGSVVAEGQIRAVREEITSQPIQVLVRCDRPRAVAVRAFALDHVVEAKLLDDGASVLVRTRDADAFYASLTAIVIDSGVAVETVLPADESVDAVYGYLIGQAGVST
jgi:ABC-2 type transport system ATP-binding protein